MPEHNLIQACVDEIRQVEPAGADRQMTRDDVPALLATPGFASELVASAACTAAPDWCGKLALFKFLVERARLDSVSRCRLGERFLSEACAELDELVARGGLDGYPAVRLTQRVYPCWHGGARVARGVPHRSAQGAVRIGPACRAHERRDRTSSSSLRRTAQLRRTRHSMSCSGFFRSSSDSPS